MNAGTYGHKLLDIYYRNKTQRMPLNENIAACLKYDPDTETCECGCMAELHKPLVGLPNVQECQRCHKCAQFRPRPFPLDLETRKVVLNRFKDYIYKYQHNDFQPISEKHVEVGFSETIYEDAENLFVLEGRIDLIAEIQGLKVVVDHKFQMQTHWLYPQSVQFKNYAMVSGCNTMIINYVRLQQKIVDTSLNRDIVSFNRPQLAAWKARLINIFWDIKKVMSYTPLPRNWDACSGYGKTFKKDEPKYCWYGTLCEEPSAATAELKENTLFKIQQEVWRPW
jgi:hypothetical protein